MNCQVPGCTMPASLLPCNLRLEIPEDVGPYSTEASWWTFEVELQLCPRHADDAGEAEAILTAMSMRHTRDVDSELIDEHDDDLDEPDQLDEDIEAVIAEAALVEAESGMPSEHAL